MSEQWASKEATEAKLKELGITNPLVKLYQCAYNYWCVDIDGGWKAPIVWSGPTADWDTETQEDKDKELLRWFRDEKMSLC